MTNIKKPIPDTANSLARVRAKRQELKAHDERNVRQGETHPRCVTSWEDVNLMRDCYETGDFTIAALADKFELPWSTVRDIVGYRTWRKPQSKREDTRHVRDKYRQCGAERRQHAQRSVRQGSRQRRTRRVRRYVEMTNTISSLLLLPAPSVRTQSGGELPTIVVRKRGMEQNKLQMAQPNKLISTRNIIAFAVLMLLTTRKSLLSISTNKTGVSPLESIGSTGCCQ